MWKSNLLPSYCCHFWSNLFKANFLALGNLECSNTTCLQNRFLVTILFSTTVCFSWQIATATSAVCKMENGAKRIVRAVACLTIINNGCLLIIIYKVFVGDGNKNRFDWFFQYVLPCCCWWHCHDSKVCRHYAVMIIKDDNLGVKLFFCHKPSFVFLESISYFFLTLILYILKYFRFIWTTIQLCFTPETDNCFYCW